MKHLPMGEAAEAPEQPNIMYGRAVRWRYHIPEGIVAPRAFNAFICQWEIAINLRISAKVARGLMPEDPAGRILLRKLGRQCN